MGDEEEKEMTIIITLPRASASLKCVREEETV
jgi:hypothetical protein